MILVRYNVKTDDGVVVARRTAFAYDADEPLLPEMLSELVNEPGERKLIVTDIAITH
jgi:hypothetical protein